MQRTTSEIAPTTHSSSPTLTSISSTLTEVAILLPCEGFELFNNIILLYVPQCVLIECLHLVTAYDLSDQ